MSTFPEDDDVTAEPAPVPRRSADSAPSATSPASSASPSTPQDGPEVAPGIWRKVEKDPTPPATEPKQAPAAPAPAPDAHHRRPLPRPVIAVGILVTVLLVVVAGWIGSSLAGPGTDDTVSPTPGSWPLDPPKLVGDLVRGEVTETSDPADASHTIVRTDYTDGTTKVVLILSRPEADVGAFLTDAGVSNTSDVGSTKCGTSTDTNSPVCAMVTDDTGLMLVGLTGQEPATLAKILLDFHDALIQ